MLQGARAEQDRVKRDAEHYVRRVLGVFECARVRDRERAAEGAARTGQGVATGTAAAAGGAGAVGGADGWALLVGDGVVDGSEPERLERCKTRCREAAADLELAKPPMLTPKVGADGLTGALTRAKDEMRTTVLRRGAPP